MKTNKKHFEIFKKECRKWIDRFELNSWRVDFEHIYINDHVYADCSASLVDHVATIRLNTGGYDASISVDIIKDSAKHEVLHLLVSRVSINGYTRFINRDEMVEGEEELVRMLSKIIK